MDGIFAQNNSTIYGLNGTIEVKNNDSYGSSVNLYLFEAIANGIFVFNAYNGGIVLVQESIASDNHSFGHSAGTHSWIQA